MATKKEAVTAAEEEVKTAVKAVKEKDPWLDKVMIRLLIRADGRPADLSELPSAAQ